jgi:hypothetical protein
MYDERQNKECRNRLIHENMAECQGPALWAYNNATFTSEDLRNITKLSGATKESDAANITIWSPDIRLGTSVRLYTAQNPRPNLPIFAASDSFVAPLSFVMFRKSSEVNVD